MKPTLTKEQEDAIQNSIASKIGKDGYEYMKKHGELPSVKLTAEEMEYIKGGIDLKNDFLRCFEFLTKKLGIN